MTASRSSTPSWPDDTSTRHAIFNRRQTINADATRRTVAIPVTLVQLGLTDARLVVRAARHKTTFLAILMAMTSAAEHMPLAEVKNRLSEVVDQLEREHGRVVITKHGRPAAVVLSIDDLEGLEETLDILSDPKLMRRVRKAGAEVAAGEAVELTKDEALALIKPRR
jgi:antitoxin YefM